MTSRRFVVHGRVQGVGFRWFAARQAARLGVVGFVRNLDDGSVEVVARGTEVAIAALSEALARGPALAHVSHVENDDFPHDMDQLTTFEIN